MANLNKTPFQLKFKQGVAANINVDATKFLAVEGEPHWTTDTDRLYIYDGTQNLGVAMLDTNDDLIVQPIANSGATFQVNQADSTNVLTVDTTNKAFQITGATSLIADAAGSVPLTVKAAASQTANLTEWQDSAGAVLAAISSTGTFGLGEGPYSTHKLHISTGATNVRGIVIDGMAGQTAALQVWRDNNNFILTQIDSNGALTVNEQGSNVDSRFEGSSATHLLYVQASNNRVGINTSSPATRLDVVATDTGVARFINTSASSANAGAGMQGGHLDGAAMSSGDRLGFYTLGGSSSVANTLVNGIMIAGFAAENWTATSVPSNLVIYLTPAGQVARVERFRIMSTGLVGIGVAAPGAMLQIDTNATTTIGQIIKAAASQTANLTEWQDSSGTAMLKVQPDGDLEFVANNIVTDTTTGTKIGTATSQKLAFFNSTPIIQPTTGVAEAAFTENAGGTAVNDDSTFGGYTIRQIVQALQNLGLLN